MQQRVEAEEERRRRGQRDAEVGRPGGPHQGDAHRQERAADVAHEVRVEGARVGHRRRQVRVPVHRAHQHPQGVGDAPQADHQEEPAEAVEASLVHVFLLTSALCSRLPPAPARAEAPRDRRELLDALGEGREGLARKGEADVAGVPAIAEEGPARGVDELDALAARRPGFDTFVCQNDSCSKLMVAGSSPSWLARTRRRSSSRSRALGLRIQPGPAPVARPQSRCSAKNASVRSLASFALSAS